MKDERQVMTKTSLEESGIKISNGRSDFVAHFDFEPYHDDIALPDGYEIPNVWSDSERSTLEDVTIDDIPDETRKKLLREARAEVIDDRACHRKRHVRSSRVWKLCLPAPKPCKT